MNEYLHTSFLFVIINKFLKRQANTLYLAFLTQRTGWNTSHLGTVHFMMVLKLPIATLEFKKVFLGHTWLSRSVISDGHRMGKMEWEKRSVLDILPDLKTKKTFHSCTNLPLIDNVYTYKTSFITLKRRLTS